MPPFLQRVLSISAFLLLAAASAALGSRVADDFVVVSRGHATEALAWTRVVMGKLGLTLNEAKTSVRDARAEQFKFLGYAFGPHRHWKTGQQIWARAPRRRALRDSRTRSPHCLADPTLPHGRRCEKS